MPRLKEFNLYGNFTMNTAMARAQLMQVQVQLNSIKKLGQELGQSRNFGLTDQIMDAVSASVRLESALGQAVNPITKNLDLTKFSNQLRMSGQTLNSFKESFQGLGATGISTFNNLAKSVAMAETPILQTSKAAQEMAIALGNTVRWQATSSLIHGVMGTAAQAMNYAKALDSSLNDIRIVTGQTSDQMDRFALQANKAAKALNTTTNAYARASLIYYQQGLSNKQVEERTETTIKLANVSGQSAKKVANQMTAIWNNFYDGGKSLEYYADVITALGASTASSSEEIAKGLSKFSSIAQTTGLSYEYATSALSTVVAATRQSADAVGTTFKTLFSRLQGLSLGDTLDDGVTLNKYSKALNTIGISVLNTNGTLKDMDSILDEMGEKWQSISKAQQVALAQTIGGVRSYTGLMSLMDNWDSFQTNLQTAQNAQGTLQAQANIYAESWEAASAHVRAASETIYNNLLNDDLIKGVTNTFGSVLDVVGQVTNSLGGFGGTMMSLVSLGSRIFEPQMTEMFNNIGYSINGRTEAIKLQNQAIADLKSPIAISQYKEVNDFSAKVNETLADNLTEYRKGVASKKIDSNLQPALMAQINAANQQGEMALAAMQTEAVNASNREFASLMEQSRLSVATRDNQDYIDKNFDKAEKQWKKVQNLSPDSQKYQQAEKNYNFWKEIEKNPGSGNLLTKEQQMFAIGSQTKAAMAVKDIYDINKGDVTPTQLQALIESNKSFVESGKASEIFGPKIAENMQKIYDQTKNITKVTDKNFQDVKNTIVTATGGADLSTTIRNSVLESGKEYYEMREDYRKEIEARFGGGEEGKRQAEAALQRLDSRLSQGDIDKYNSMIQKAQFGKAQKYLEGQLKAADARDTITSLGAGLTTITGTFASIGTTLSSVNKAVSVFKDETSTVQEKTSSIVTTLGTLPMTFSSIARLSGSWKNEIFGTSLTVGKLFTGLSTAALAVGGLAIATREINKYTEEGAIKNYTAAVATSAQMASEAQQKYEQLGVSQQVYQQQLNALNNTQKGTLANTKALLETNETASNLIEDYKLQYGTDYTYGDNGAILINATAFQEAEKKAEEEAQNRIYGQMYTKAAKDLLTASSGLPTEPLKQQVRDFFDTEISYFSKGSWFTSGGEKSQDFYSLLLDYYTSAPGLKYKDSENKFLSFLQDKGFTDKDLSQITNLFNATDWKDVEAGVKSITQSVLPSERPKVGWMEKENFESFDHSKLNEAISHSIGEYSIKEIAAAQQMLNTAAQQANATGLQTDLAIAYLSLDERKLVDDRKKLSQWASNIAQEDLWKTAKEIAVSSGFNTPEDYYRAFMDTSDLSGLTPQEISTAVIQKGLEQGNIYGAAGIKALLGDDLYQEVVGNQLDGITGLTEVLERIENLGISNLNTFKSLNTKELTKELSGLKDKIAIYQDQLDLAYSSGANEEYIKSLEADIKFLEDYEKAVEKTEKDTVKSVMESLSYSLSSEALTEAGEDGAYSAYKKLTEQGYSLNQLQSIGGYLTQARTFYGENTANVIYDAFTTAGYGTKTFEALNNIDWSTSLSSLADLSEQAKKFGDQSKNLYRDILESAVEDIGGEGGIFQQLYSSKGFSKILDKLEDVYDANGKISAQDIVKYAPKSDELAQYLQIGENTDLNLTSGGLAATLTAIESGAIKAEEVTTGLVNALSVAESRETAQAEAFSYVDNQDLGRSAGDYIKFFREWGKGYYTSKTNRLTMDDPMLNIMSFMPAHIQEAYFEGLANGEFKSFNDIMKSDPALQEFTGFLDILAGTGKYKGKGGGYMTDVIEQFGNWLSGYSMMDEYGQNILQENGSPYTGLEYLIDKGILIGRNPANNQIDMFLNEAAKNMTTPEFEKIVTEALTSFMGKEQAGIVSSIFTGYIGSTSAGYTLKQNDVSAAIDEMWKAGEKGQHFDNGYGGQHFYSVDELRAFYDISKGFIDKEKYGDNFESFVKAIVQGEDGRNAQLLAKVTEPFKDGVNLGKDTLDAIFTANKELQEAYGTYNKETFTDISSLLYSFGAITTTEDGKNYLDVNRFTDFMVASGGSESAANAILQGLGKNSYDYFANLSTGSTLGYTFKDRMGNSWSMTQNKNESFEDFSKRYQETYSQMMQDTYWVEDSSKEFGGYELSDPTGHKIKYMLESNEWKYDSETKTWSKKEGGWDEDTIKAKKAAFGVTPGDLGESTAAATGGTQSTPGTGEETTPSTTTVTADLSNPPPSHNTNQDIGSANYNKILNELGGYEKAAALASEAGFRTDAGGITSYFKYMNPDSAITKDWKLTDEQIAYAEKTAQKTTAKQQADQMAAEMAAEDAELAKFLTREEAKRQAAEMRARAEANATASAGITQSAANKQAAAMRARAEANATASAKITQSAANRALKAKAEAKAEALRKQQEAEAKARDEAFLKEQRIEDLIANGYTQEEATKIANGEWTEAEVETARIQAQIEANAASAAKTAKEVETQNFVDQVNSLMAEGYTQNIAEEIALGNITKEQVDQDIAFAKAVGEARERDKGFNEASAGLTPEQQAARQEKLATIKDFAEQYDISEDLAREYLEKGGDYATAAGLRDQDVAKMKAAWRAGEEAEENAERQRQSAEDAARKAEEAKQAEEARNEAEDLYKSEEAARLANIEATRMIEKNPDWAKEYAETGEDVTASEFVAQKQKEMADAAANAVKNMKDFTDNVENATEATADMTEATETTTEEATESRGGLLGFFDAAKEAAEAAINFGNSVELGGDAYLTGLSTQTPANVGLGWTPITDESGNITGYQVPGTSTAETPGGETVSTSDYNQMIEKANGLYNQMLNGGELSAEDMDFMSKYADLLEANGGDASTINQIRNLVSEAVDQLTAQTDLAEAAAEENTNPNGTQSNLHVDENGKLVDENNNEVILPYGQSYTTSEGVTYTGGSYTATDANGNSYTVGYNYSSGGKGGNYSGNSSSSSSSSNDGGVSRHIEMTGVYDNSENIKEGGIEHGTARMSDDWDYEVFVDKNGIMRVERDDNGDAILADTTHNAEKKGEEAGEFWAKGKNNAQLPQFASGKEGSIAVTGELGPELRVKEDGSMDIVGQHGREFVWVNSNDRIYTAAQTASILANNNIEELQQFAEGFNNKIRGYASNYVGSSATTYENWDNSTVIASTDNGGGYSGSSYSGGGRRSYSRRSNSKFSSLSNGISSGMMGEVVEEEKDPRYDMYTLKLRDMLERYYTILQQIDNITIAVEHFAKVADRAWGEERIQAIQKQTSLYKEQYAAQQKYVSEIKENLYNDRKALETMFEEFARDYSQNVDIFGSGTSGSGTSSQMSSGSGLWNAMTDPTGQLGRRDGLRIDPASGLPISGTKTKATIETPIMDEKITAAMDKIKEESEKTTENQASLMERALERYWDRDNGLDIDYFGGARVRQRDVLDIASSMQEETSVRQQEIKNLAETIQKDISSRPTEIETIVSNTTDGIFKHLSDRYSGLDSSLRNFNYQYGPGNWSEEMSTTRPSWMAGGMEQFIDPTGQLGLFGEMTAEAAEEESYSPTRIPLYWEDAEFDEHGVLTNYDSFMEAIIDAYNENAQENAYNKEAQYKFQEMLKDIQMYTQTLNLYEQEREKLYDLRNAILDSQIIEIVYRVQYENELDNNALREINYEFNKVRDNTYRAAEAIDYYSQKMDFLTTENKRYTNSIKDILATYSGNVRNGQEHSLEETVYKLINPGKEPPPEPETPSLDGFSFEDETAHDRIQFRGDDVIFNAGMKGEYTVKASQIGGERVVDGLKETMERERQISKDMEAYRIMEEKGTLSSYYGDMAQAIRSGQDVSSLSMSSYVSSGFGGAIGRPSWMTGGMEGFIDPTGQLGLLGEIGAEETAKYEGPSREEILKYLEDFHEVTIGGKTYYVPNNGNVEVNSEYMVPLTFSKVVLDENGDLTPASKDTVTKQVKEWYDDLKKNNPKLEIDVTPVYDETGFMTNFRDVLKAVNEAEKKMSDDMWDLLLSSPQDFFDKFSEITIDNIDFQDLTAETIAQLENTLQAQLDQLQVIQQNFDAVLNKIGDSVKEFNKKLNLELDEYDYFNEVLTNFENIVNLTNRRLTNIDSAFMTRLQGSMLDNNINKINGSKAIYESMVKDVDMIRNKLDMALAMSQDSVKNELRAKMSDEEYARWEADLQRDIDNYEDNLKLAQQKTEDAHKQFLKSWEEALSKISDIYSSAIKEATRNFEESFSPYFNTLDLLQAQFDREKAIGDYYVDNYERIHDLSALDRAIEESILGTDNLKSKSRLRDLQKEINDLQENSTELSEYDLEILDKKYQIELARQALEDAKNAKSIVRLSRDNNGNWSYVYSADETDIEEAEQNYEDTIRSMEEINENYIDNLESQILQVQQSAEAAIANLNPEDFANAEEYWMAIENIKNGAEQTMAYLAQQINNAFANNDWLDPYIIDRFGSNMHNLTNDWGDMTLSAVSGIGTLNEAVQLAKDNLDALGVKAFEAFEEYSQKQQEVYEMAGSDLTNATEYFDENINKVNEASENEINIINKMVERMETSFENTLDEMSEFIKKYYTQMYDIANEESYVFVKLLHERLNELIEISGEYVPPQQIDFTNSINTQFELDQILSVLKEYGRVIVTDYDSQGNQRIYDLVEGSAETAAALAEWNDRILKREVIDVDEDLDTQEEFDQIKQYLEKHGEVYISIDGELKKLRADNEEDINFLAEKLIAIEKAAEVIIDDYMGDGKLPEWMYQNDDPFMQRGYGLSKAELNNRDNFYFANESSSSSRFSGIFGDTGMYTGEWSGGSEHNNGRLAWLHQKELVLNEHDTENFLDAIGIVRQLDNLTSWMANGLGDLFSPNVTTEEGTLQQEVHIDASFPNVTDHNEIEEAFGNLVNLASQYANRKAFV